VKYFSSLSTNGPGPSTVVGGLELASEVVVVTAVLTVRVDLSVFLVPHTEVAPTLRVVVTVGIIETLSTLVVDTVLATSEDISDVTEQIASPDTFPNPAALPVTGAGGPGSTKYSLTGVQNDNQEKNDAGDLDKHFAGRL